jgi:ElaB/YqjD/DUF883 family membrane-anchored ribosome-binding protein
MTTEQASDRVVKDLKLIIRDAEALLKATAGQADDKVTEVRERLNLALDSAKKTCEHLQERTVEAAKTADRVVRDHPYESIGVAFGVGLLFGLFVSRK